MVSKLSYRKIIWKTTIKLPLDVVIMDPQDKHLEKIKTFLKMMEINEIIEKPDESIIDVPLKLDLQPNESLELTNRIFITKEGWILIKCLLMFSHDIPEDPKVIKSLWGNLLQGNFDYPEITYSLDKECNIFVETDMLVTTTFENFQCEYNSLKEGALNYFDQILPNIDGEFKKGNTFERIHHIYLFTSSGGIVLFDQPFKLAEELEPSLVTGGLASLTSIIQEITKEETKIKIIEQEKMNILLEHGNYITGALVTEENYLSLRKKLKSLITNVEEKYLKQLKNFNGDIVPFENIVELIEKCFGKSVS